METLEVMAPELRQAQLALGQQGLQLRHLRSFAIAASWYGMRNGMNPGGPGGAAGGGGVIVDRLWSPNKGNHNVIDIWVIPCLIP